MLKRFRAEPGAFGFRAELLADEQNESPTFFPCTLLIIRLAHLGAILIARRWTKGEVLTHAVLLANEKISPSIRIPNAWETRARGQG
jgi:hypothetical protein